MIDVSIVIVNWNAGDYLARAVESVLADFFVGRREVIVVDNASTDGSISRLDRDDRALTVLQMGTNAGFARACNSGVRASAGRWVLFLNPDAELEPGALSALVLLGDEQADTAIVGGSVVAPDGSVDPASRRKIPTPGMAFARLFRAPVIARLLGVPAYEATMASEETAEVEAVSGSFLLVRRAAYESLGGFDERFFLYAEDLDLCLRARQTGWKVRSTRRARALHNKHVCAARAPYRALWHFYRTMILFHRKHYARDCSLLLNLVVYAGVAALLGVGAVRVALAPRGRPLRLATARHGTPGETDAWAVDSSARGDERPKA